MGKKSHRHLKNTESNVSHGNQNVKPKKLSPQKRIELNQLLDKLMKVCCSVPESFNANKEWEAYLEIQEILNEVNAIEADLLQSLPPRSSAIEDFLTWLRTNNVEFDGLEIAEYPELGFGIKAGKDFKEGDLMIAVPRAVMLTAEKIHESPLRDLAMSEPLLTTMPNIALAMLLLLQRHDSASFWKPYINVLPQKYTTVLYYSPDEIFQLKGSPTFEMALKQCRFIARQYTYFNQMFQTLCDEASRVLRKKFTYEDYRWAVSTVMTRQNAVVSADGSGTTQALIPFWDMCNHADGKLSTDFNVSLDRSECVAWQAVPKGSQVFIFYGERPHSEMLVHNGFLSRGACKSVRLRLGVSKTDPLYSERAALLSRLGLTVTGDWELRAGPLPVSPELWAFVRVFNMDKDQLDFYTSADSRVETLMEEDCPLNADLEERVNTFLTVRIKLLLAAYPTKIEDDEELLADSSSTMSPNARLAVMLRLEEKQLMQRALVSLENRRKSRY